METAVRFAYTLIQPWSLGLVCKCDAIFRPVSRVYNTFGWRILSSNRRAPGPSPLRTCACTPPRTWRVRVRAIARSVRERGQADTSYTCVPLQLQDPPNRLPTRLFGTNTSLRDTDSNTERGSPRARARVSFGREHRPSSLRPPSLSLFLLRRLHLRLSFLLSTSFFFFLFLLLLFLSLLPSRAFPASHLPLREPHRRDMHDHQTALTAEVTHPSTRRCLPMDSWKTDWDFLEAIRRNLRATLSLLREE